MHAAQLDWTQKVKKKKKKKSAEFVISLLYEREITV